MTYQAASGSVPSHMRECSLIRPTRRQQGLRAERPASAIPGCVAGLAKQRSGERSSQFGVRSPLLIPWIDSDLGNGQSHAK